jgi:putative hemolysin
MTTEDQVAENFPLHKETDDAHFAIDITKDPALIDQAFSLRYQVFNIELGEGLESSHATQRDTDQYDEFCDHLVVIDKNKNLVVGTYRIMPYQQAVNNKGFYSETEFDLSNVYKNMQDSAEMGRCCVHKDYRNGMVMNLLWYGLANYMELNNINYLFGCTSLNKGDGSEVASLIYKVCETVDALAGKEFSITPQPGFAVEGFDKHMQLPEANGNPKRLLPSIMRGYLTVGVKICGEPAYDPEFDVIDFFTIFDFRGINRAARRFFSK